MSTEFVVDVLHHLESTDPKYLLLALTPSLLFSLSSLILLWKLVIWFIVQAYLLLLLIEMEKASPQNPKSTTTRSQLDESVLPNRIVEFADAYPDNLIVRFLVVPFARHPFN